MAAITALKDCSTNKKNWKINTYKKLLRQLLHIIIAYKIIIRKMKNSISVGVNIA